MKAYPVIPLVGYYDLRDEKPTDGNKLHRKIFQQGYSQAIKDLATIVQQFADKGDRCMDQSATDDDQGGYTFWDGFHDCAINILRELKDE